MLSSNRFLQPRYGGRYHPATEHPLALGIIEWEKHQQTCCVTSKKS